MCKQTATLDGFAPSLVLCTYHVQDLTEPHAHCFCSFDMP